MVFMDIMMTADEMVEVATSNLKKRPTKSSFVRGGGDRTQKAVKFTDGSAAAAERRLSQSSYRSQGQSSGSDSHRSTSSTRRTRVSHDEKRGAEADTFRVEAAIYENRTQALQARTLVSENASLIAKNYSAAFNGNRQLTHQNTEDLFRNKQAMLSAMQMLNEANKGHPRSQFQNQLPTPIPSPA